MTLQRDKKRPPSRVVIDRSTTKREIVFQLASDQALWLMRHDRLWSRFEDRNVMAWSMLETTQGLRYIEACCFGTYGDLGNPNDPTSRSHRKEAYAKGERMDFGNMTEFNMLGMRMIFTITCVAEMRRGRSLDNRRYDIVLPGMKQEWYAELIDEACDIVDMANGNLALSVSHWLNSVRKPVIKQEVRKLKASADIKALDEALDSVSAEASARLDRNPETKQMAIRAEAEVNRGRVAEVIQLFSHPA